MIAPDSLTLAGSVLFEGTTPVGKGLAMRLSNQETGESFGSEISDKGQFEFEGMKPGRYIVALQGGGGYFLGRCRRLGQS